jgi:predicted  nucleic acid-binding Zn-ribbon protein
VVRVVPPAFTWAGGAKTRSAHLSGNRSVARYRDELNDNIDTYVSRKSDLRKVLKLVIDGDTEFQAKLRALRDDVTAKKEEMEQYEFLLSNALETLDSSVQDHRQLLSEQEEAAKLKKKPARP